jgi:hypothetical protein
MSWRDPRPTGRCEKRESVPLLGRRGVSRGQLRPVLAAAMTVVPDPEKAFEDDVVATGAVADRIRYQLAGFTVGCIALHRPALTGRWVILRIHPVPAELAQMHVVRVR